MNIIFYHKYKTDYLKIDTVLNASNNNFINIHKIRSVTILEIGVTLKSSAVHEIH